MTRLGRWALAAVLTAICTVPALAADLTDADLRTLERDFGVGRGSRLIHDMTQDERAELDRLLNDSSFAQSPKVRSDNAADYLYHVHLRECHAWQPLDGRAQDSCPPTGNPTVDAGQTIAEQHCNYCHLFGTPAAPSFHKVALDGLTQAQLASALEKGHQMSPIGMQPSDVAALYAYILSLK
jgi:hypothetical protein